MLVTWLLALMCFCFKHFYNTSYLSPNLNSSNRCYIWILSHFHSKFTNYVSFQFIKAYLIQTTLISNKSITFPYFISYTWLLDSHFFIIHVNLRIVISLIFLLLNIPRPIIYIKESFNLSIAFIYKIYLI